jgi:hypothetical protein
MARPVTVEDLTTALTRALGNRLVSLVLYGSAARGTHVPARSDVNTLLIADEVDSGLFAALAPALHAWTRAGHPAPLLFSEREWRESRDTFPIEYEDIRHAHRVLAGRDPWAGVTVSRAALRAQLERELMGKLLRLRQAYAALGADPKPLAAAIVGSAGGFFTMLRTVLRLAGKTAPASSADLVREAAATIGFPADGLGTLVTHAAGGPALKLAARDPLPDAYLTALARTAAYVNHLA